MPPIEENDNTQSPAEQEPETDNCSAQQKGDKKPSFRDILPKPEPDRDDVRAKTVLGDILTCLAAALCVSLSLYYFSNYNGFAPGGISGIASILAYFLAGKGSGDITQYMSLLMFCLNFPIFLLVAIFVSKKTGIMLCLYLAAQSLLLMLFKELHVNPNVHLSYYDAYDYEAGNNLVYAAIGVGVISGFGFSLMIRRFGASGGTYAITALIKRFRPAVNLAWFTFFLDAAVVVLAFFVYRSGANPVISTLCNIFISDIVVDFTLQGVKNGYKFEIITERAEEISAELMSKLGRGVTTIHAEGMYTHTDKTLLICIVRKRQVGEFLKILKRYNTTFSYSCRVNEVYGKFENHPKKVTIESNGKRCKHCKNAKN